MDRAVIEVSKLTTECLLICSKEIYILNRVSQINSIVRKTMLILTGIFRISNWSFQQADSVSLEWVWVRLYVHCTLCHLKERTAKRSKLYSAILIIGILMWYVSNSEHTVNTTKHQKEKKNIVTCRVVRVTKITGSRSDDWIYWHFGYSLS
jgi:hypothetical protein